MNATRIQSLATHFGKPQQSTLKMVGDADLLGRFLDYQDEAAFEELVGRHFPAVRAICRSVLRDANDVDDAAQATFLVLVRRARDVRNRLALGSWLCRVAWRTANRLRESNMRRSEKLIPGLDPDTTPERPPHAGNSEIVSAIQDEIRLLPERYRIAVLTCYCSGLPTAEAASRLGWPKGTLLTRLAWARKRLRERLLRRGVAPVACLTTLFAERSSQAADVLLICRLVSAGMAMATGNTAATGLISRRVSTLTEGMVRNMIATKVKLVLGIGILFAALVGLGLGRLAFGTADAAAGDKKASSPLTTANASAGQASGTSQGKNDNTPNEAEAAKGEPANTALGNELVVRRPLGSYTREVLGIGKATVTFTENRIHFLANLRFEKVSYTATLDADYSMNRESMVYGIITGIDFSAPVFEGGSQGAVEEDIATIAARANDIPFAFRVRVEDDSIMVKDVKCGPYGSLIFGLGNGGKIDKESLLITGLVGGKYKAVPTPEWLQPAPPVPTKKK